MTPKSIFPALALSPELQIHISEFHFNIPQATKTKIMLKTKIIRFLFFPRSQPLLYFFASELANFTHYIVLKSAFLSKPCLGTLSALPRLF